jgi:hypothetical protein
MSKINKTLEYPRQCASIVMDKTLTCDAWLTRASAANEASPLEIFRTTTDAEKKAFASRFGLILINEDKKAATGNIELNEMYNIISRTNFALNKSYELELKPKVETSEKNIAYTVKFVAGNLKGKSPAQVIFENGEDEGKKILNEQYVFLKNNLQKYKDNQKIMDAITECGKLLKEGKLKKPESTSISSNEFLIYNGGMKPLIRKKDPKNPNLCKVYEIKVICDFSRRYPVNIQIQNYYAPVDKQDNGTLNVQKSQMDKSSLINNQINVTLTVWEGFIRSIERCINAFERCFSTLCLKESSAAIQKQNERYRKEPTPAAPVVEDTKVTNINIPDNTSGYETFEDYEGDLPFNI